MVNFVQEGTVGAGGPVGKVVITKDSTTALVSANMGGEDDLLFVNLDIRAFLPLDSGTLPNRDHWHRARRVR